MEARVIIETDLRRRPSKRVASKGRLPEGSIVTVRGTPKAEYVLVEVELEDGELLSGWVNQNTLAPSNVNKAKKITPKRRAVIPRDEAILLGRRPSIFFGASIGINYSILQPKQLPSSEFTYLGMGFMGGAYLGLYASRQVPVRFELNYMQYRATSPDEDPNVVLNYGFLELAVVPSLLIGRAELFAGLGYAFGLSRLDSPSGFDPTASDEPGDLSSLVAQVGAGYNFELKSEVALAARFRYTLHFQSSNILRHGMALVVAIGLKG